MSLSCEITCSTMAVQNRLNVIIAFDIHQSFQLQITHTGSMGSHYDFVKKTRSTGADNCVS
jgi:hypothetical protein